jgi:cholesterol 7-desaturase
MQVRQFDALARPADEAHPPALPYPDGWFCVGVAAEWKRGTVLTKPFMGEDIVVYRTATGALNAVRPYCPHLGAHLGVGGSVDGELLVCPFHGFAFGAEGWCARTPYGSPPRARLQLLPVTEAAGVVWVWHSQDGSPPSWALPEALFSLAVRRMRSHATDVAGHPQDLQENAIDVGHLPYLHNVNVEVLSEPKGDGPFYSFTYRLRRPMPPLGTVTQEAHFTLIGMAGFLAELCVSADHLNIATWALATPIAPWRMRFWLASSVSLALPGTSGRMRDLTSRALEPALSRFMNRRLVKDARHDLPIYHHKKYIHHPKLNDADGPIGAFRIWSRQFYPCGSYLR